MTVMEGGTLNETALFGHEEQLAYFEREAVKLLDELAAFTRTSGEGGGVTRLLYTEEWLAAQRHLESRMAACGLETAFDEVGNLFGKLRGETGLPSVLAGSHIDTVVEGGKYDGAFGIAASLIAVDYLRRVYGRPKRTVEVVSLCEEEGSRFPLAYWGSGSIAGMRGFTAAEELRDAEDVSLREAMRACGFGEGTHRAARRTDIAAYVEVHVEQGAVLEREGLKVGVVDAIAGQRRFLFEVGGEANHAGTTPMLMRRDALEGACAMIAALQAEAVRLGPPLVATVGRLHIQPNVSNVVPGKAEFTVDIRHADEEALDRLAKWTVSAFGDIARRRKLELRHSEWLREAPVPMDGRLTGYLDDACAELDVPFRRMMSGAGHDAQMFRHVCPTAMLFVPSRGGISHSPEEYTPPRELAVGVAVLARLLYRLGYEEAQL